jgi:hypothetical protein
MSSTLKRVAAVAALGTVGLLAPAAGASAATTPIAPPPAFTFSWPKYAVPTLPAFNPGSLSFVGPSVGALSVAIGPTVITVGAGNIFTNTTITTSGGGSIVGAP